MGHADLATTQIYMHYAPAAQDAALIDAAFGPGTHPGTKPSAATPTSTNSDQLEAA
jgi:hypothetical protein